MSLKFNGDVFDIDTFHQHFAGDKKKVQAALAKYGKFRVGRLSYPNDYPDLWEAVTDLVCSYHSACPACGRIASLSFDHRDEVFILSHECEQWKGFMKTVAPSQLVPFLKTLQHDRFACDSNVTAVGRNEYGLTMATYTNHYFGYDFAVQVRLRKHILEEVGNVGVNILENIFSFDQKYLLNHPYYRKGRLEYDVCFVPNTSNVLVITYEFSGQSPREEKFCMQGTVGATLFSPTELLEKLWRIPIKQMFASADKTANTFGHLADTPF